jgi:hypothetical protein
MWNTSRLELRKKSSSKNKQVENANTKKMCTRQHTNLPSLSLSLADNFNGKLEQLTFSDVPETDLEDLEPLSQGEFKA